MFSWEEDKANLKTAGGSIAGIFGGLGSYLGPNHKVLAFSFAAVGVLFLIATIVIQMQNRTHASKLTHAVIGLATVTFIYFGYNEARRPTAATTPPSPAQQQTPVATAPVVVAPSPVTNSAETKETRSPAVAGNNNTVIYSDAAPEMLKKKK